MARGVEGQCLVHVLCFLVAARCILDHLGLGHHGCGVPQPGQMTQTDVASIAVLVWCSSADGIPCKLAETCG